MRGRLAIFLTVVLMLVVLVALNAASYVRVERPADSEFVPDRSTLNAGSTGTRALFEFLQQSGHTVARWHQPPAALLRAGESGPRTLVIVGQVRQGVSPAEAETLLRWVREGGRLVLVDRTPDSSLLPHSGRWGVAPEIFEYPDATARPDVPASMTRGVEPTRPSQPTPLTRGVEQVLRSRFAARLHVYTEGGRPKGAGAEADALGDPPPPPRPIPPAVRESPGTDEAEESNGEEGPTEEEAGPGPAVGPAAGGAQSAGAARESAGADRDGASAPSGTSPAPVVHLSDGRGGGAGALLVDYAYGRGRIVVLADPYIVSNGGIGLADNLRLAVGVVAGGGAVAFDEYHQGYGATRNEVLGYFAGTPVLLMFAQVLVIVLAVVWTRGRRFARPLPAPHVDRRSNLEFVASMAELQQRARAYDLAVENIYGRTRRALARYGGASAGAPAPEIAARVAARSGRAAGELAELMRECEDAIAGAPLSARRALALVARLRDVERELGIRMRAREIRQAEARQ